MVLRNIISPTAGRMRPNTSASGIFSTKRSSAVSVSILTRMLVPKPKNAFQSPTVHNIGQYVERYIELGMVTSDQKMLPAKGADAARSVCRGYGPNDTRPLAGRCRAGGDTHGVVPRLNRFSAIVTQRACHFGMSAVFQTPRGAPRRNDRFHGPIRSAARDCEE